MNANQPFGDRVEVYESLIDWPRRLDHEQAFYRRLFEPIPVRRLVDVACGTGHHAAMFHSWGLAVEGSDVSPEMIQRARQRHGETETLRWVARSFDQPIETKSPIDAAICVGNSLALAGSLEAADQAIARMLGAVRPGGLVVVHVLNLWHLPDGPCLWQKCRRTTGSQGDRMVVKGVHRCGRSGFVDLIIVSLDGPPVMESESVPFLGLEADWLEDAAVRAGSGDVEFFGGYADQPYHRDTSVDLIMVARHA
ncbi:MAG: class I SAM-dependent methyltransferase [Planctomycetes bacterium]|nr:class I SAM-dependent methyltransferase [Planctomycetota bacterium]